MEKWERAEAVERHYRGLEGKIFHTRISEVNRFGDTVTVRFEIVELQEIIKHEIYPEDFGKVGIDG